MKNYETSGKESTFSTYILLLFDLLYYVDLYGVIVLRTQMTKRILRLFVKTRNQHHTYTHAHTHKIYVCVFVYVYIIYFLNYG